MADAAARREARRRRILENSENRLQQITGKAKESAINDKSNDGSTSTKSNFINGFVFPESISIDEATNQTKEFEYQDRNTEFEKIKNLESKKQLQENNDIASHYNKYNEYNLKNIESASADKKKNCDNLKFISSSTSISEQSNAKLTQGIYLYYMFFSPISVVILAACLNILVLMNASFSVHTGIIMPCVILITTQLYLGRTQDIHGSGILIAALVLCNIKAEIVHTFKKLITHLDTIVKNFALYITSFIFINWITTIVFYNSRQIQFF